MSSLRKNVASQNFTFCLVSATTGLGVAGASITAYVTKDGAAQGAAAGTTTSQGNGQYNYAPTQAETNATDVGFFFTATGCVPCNLDFHTDVVDANGLVSVNLVDIAGSAVSTTSAQLGVNVIQVNGTTQTAKDLGASATQTGDSFARLGAPAGASVSADIAAVKSDTGTILTDVNTGAGAIYTRLGAPAGASIAADIAAVEANAVTLVAGVNVTNIGGSALSTHAAGMIPADVRDIVGVAVSTTTAQLGVNAVQYNAQTTQTDANGLPKVDIVDVAGSAVATGSAQLGVNVVQWNGQATQNDANNLPKVDIEAVNGNTTAAQNVSHTMQAIGRGTCTIGGSTTSVVTSAFAPAGAAAGQFLGRVIIFDANTTTAALQGQATVITASSNAAAPVFTVVALTTAPSSGDTFSVV